MSADNFDQFFPKKAYEISYALFRLSSSVKPVFGEYLERHALALLDSVSGVDYGKTGSILGSIIYLARFGGDIGEISNKNVDLIVGEAESLNAAIAELGKSAKPANVDLEDVFSPKPGSRPNTATPKPLSSANISLDNKGYGVFAKSGVRDEALMEAEVFGSLSGKPDEFEANVDTDIVRTMVDSKQEQPASGGDQGINKAEMRQSAILEKMRQSGNCRLRDLQEILSGASERTIRYDLQDLVSRGFVERVGSGGPATYYRIKNTPRESNF